MRDNLTYQGKILSLSLIWHVVLFAGINTEISCPVLISEKNQETVFLGTLLSNFDLSPIYKQDKPIINNNYKFSDVCQRINLFSFPNFELVQSKAPLTAREVDSANKEILQLKIPFAKNKGQKDNSTTAEFKFLLDTNKYKLTHYKTMPKICDFKISQSRGNTVILVERLTTTGILSLDMELEQFVKKELLAYQQINFNKVRVDIIY